ncbi:MAG: M56 family metallopeptidase [Mucilaginibacter sp.]
MPALFIFLLKVNVALIVFCIGYYLVLRHLTFYTLNRIYLVAAILFSTLYPTINLSDFVTHHQQLAQPVQTVILHWKTPAENFVKPLDRPDYWAWAEMVFWAGVILFAARLLVQLSSVYKLYLNSKPGNIDDYRVRLVRDDISPFSFWRNIYINPASLSPGELKSILEHETVHVNQWHTLDILLAELSTVFYWFNPGVWLMKKAVRENIEFITDCKILQKGMDSKQYQYSLLSVCLGTRSNTIANHFNISTIKKRIIMMNSKKSAGYKLTRYVLLVPVVIVLLMAFSLSKAEAVKKEIKNTVRIIGNAVSRINPVTLNKPKTVNGKKGISRQPKIIATTGDTLYAGKSKDGKGAYFMTTSLSNDSIAYVINGVKATKDDMKALDPSKKLSMDLVEPERARSVFSDADTKHYTLFVATDDSEAGKQLQETINKSSGNLNLSRIRNITLHTTSSDNESITGTSSGVTLEKTQNTAPLIMESKDKNKTTTVVLYTDTKKTGKTMPKNIFDVRIVPNGNVVLNGVKIDTSIDVLIDTVKTINGLSERAKKKITYTYTTKINGDAKPEAITIVDVQRTSNDPIVVKGFLANSEMTLTDHPLIIIDGRESKTFKNIAPDDIKSISVFKDKSATDAYGDKGKNGVIVITTKKEK